MPSPSNFSSGATVTSAKELTDPETASKDHLATGRKAAAQIIDSGTLGDGPFNVQIAGSAGDTPGAANQITVTVTTVVPPTPPA